jgi:uncharacterized protein
MVGGLRMRNAPVKNPLERPVFLPYPQIELLFTDKCNLDCTYCFEKYKENRSIRKEDIDPLLDSLVTREFYLFGGEPLLELELITYMIDRLNARQFDETAKQHILNSCRFHITNGTLIEKNMEIIKKYNLNLQISLDGPKSVNDKNRVYFNGNGSFDDVMKGVETCQANGITWFVHGAIGKNNVGLMFDIMKFYFDLEAKYRGLESAIRTLGVNIFQVVFEDDYTDEDIDLFLEQFVKCTEWIWNNTEYDMTFDQRQQAYINWCYRRGSSCIAGNKMIAVDAKFDVYPCHRLAMLKKKDEFSLLNLKDPERKFQNYQLFNSFLQINSDRCMYGPTQSVIEWRGDLCWHNWCPSANVEGGSSVFYQHPKHNLLIAELGRLIHTLNDVYGLNEERILQNRPTMRSCMNDMKTSSPMDLSQSSQLSADSSKQMSGDNPTM